MTENITLTISKTDAERILSESYTFRCIMIDRSAKPKSKIRELGEALHQAVLSGALDTEDAQGKTRARKIPAIKFVRTWLTFNKHLMDEKEFIRLYDLKGAKDFVEQNVNFDEDPSERY